MYSDNKQIRDVADVAARIMSGQQPVTEKLHPNQQQLDVHEPEKDELTADDFKKLRAKKEVKKEEVEELDEEDAYEKDRYAVKNGKAVKDNPTHQGSPNYKDQPHHVYATSAENALKKHTKKEEVEQIQEYQSKDGKYTHKGTYGTAKGAEYGETDYDKENELAKAADRKKPNRKKYGARQNFVRSSRVNETFSGLLSVYKEQGLKGLSEAMIKEEPDNEQFTKELEDNKSKAEGKKTQPNLAKGSVQAVKQEEVEIQVINADLANGVEEITIEEREMSEPEMNKREEIVKSMKKGMTGFKERYGKDAKSVMYATATKQAMKD